jgi:choline dehydrogenase-like flavoprotein
MSEQDRTPAAPADVCVVGAGVAGGIVAAELAERGFDVVLLESGERFDPDDRLTQMEQAIRPEHDDAAVWNMGGPRDRFSSSGAVGYALNDRRVKGVGGTTLIYTGNHPRAYPAAIDEQEHWPDEISYADLLPYYREVEELLGVQPAPVTAKEELFFQGAAEAGWDLVDGKNVTDPGVRPL